MTTFLQRWFRLLFLVLGLPLLLVGVHEAYRSFRPTSAPIEVPPELLGPPSAGPAFPLTRNDVAPNQTPQSLEDDLGQAEPPAKKHFWQKAKPPVEDDSLRRPGDDVAEPGSDIRRRMTSAPERPQRASLPEAPGRGPSPGWCGAQVLVSKHCPIGQALIFDLEHNGVGWTVGPGPQFHFWVVYDEAAADCPTIVFYRDGREGAPRIIGYAGRAMLGYVFVCHPLRDVRVEHWHAPADVFGPPSCTFQLRAVPASGWGPGFAVRYKSNTDVGVGAGFGSGWSRPTGGN